MSSRKVTLVEMGLRDGLQNEKKILSLETKVGLGQKLIQSGVRRMESGAFVSPKWVPQMADSLEVTRELLAWSPGTQLAALVPNEQGMLQALSSGIKEVAIFAACSESFSEKNINCSIDESFARFAPVMKLARKHKIKVRGYLSTCFGCPFEGSVDEAKVIALAVRMFKLGVYEVSIGDTIGVASAGQVERIFKRLIRRIPVKKLAGHFHDTRGQALVNIYTAWKLGVSVFDSSLGGLGGCPYAPGSTGNVATEDVVYMFDGLGVTTGLDLKKLIQANEWMSKKMGSSLPSKVSRAQLSARSI